LKIIGKEIGSELDDMYHLLVGRAGVAGRDLKVVAFEGDGLSDVQWTAKAVTISLHSGVPTHALPHVFAIALQHVRQTLDGYPNILKPPGRQPEGSDLVRGALRELVAEPDAEAQLHALGLDRTWENEQRHQGMKSLLQQPPADWNEPESLGGLFLALQYARMSLTHPPQMWKALQKRAEEVVPVAAERGEQVLTAVKKKRWGSASAALESYIRVREELGVEDMVRIEDASGVAY
jgi:hypothetical protein